MFGILRNAMKSKMLVEMIYMSEKGDISQRVITVYDVSQSHIKAFCHNKKQVRIFKVENILTVFPYKRRRKNVS